MLIRKISTSILFCFLISSCSSLYQEGGSSGTAAAKKEGSDIRIVDLEGNYRPTKRQVPLFNSQLMQQQYSQSVTGESVHQNQQAPTKPSVTKDFGDDFGPSDDDLLEIGQKDEAGDEVEAQIEYKINKLNPSFEDEELETEEDQTLGKQKIFKTSRGSSAKGLFVQIGSYASKNSANSILNKGQEFSQGLIKEVRSGNKTIHKILLGPVTDKPEAVRLLKKVKQNGFSDAFITKIK